VAAIALAVALLAGTAAGPTTATGAEVRKVTEKTIPFTESGAISIENQNGRITVEAWDRSDVRIQITRIARASDAQKAEEYLKQIRAEMEVTGSSIEIRSRFPKRNEKVGLFDVLSERVASFQIQYYLQVPVRTALALESTNGGIRVRGTRDGLKAETTNGNIELAGVTGTIATESTNGGIEVRNAAGSVAAATTNGGILIELKKLDAGGKVSAETTNGSVEVYLPGTVKANLEAETTNGRVSVTLPVTSKGPMTSKSVRGTMGGGGPDITLATTNGNIEVRRLEDRAPR
jgi:DUF4097 and DUF4098 domain-containing protein YvlB